MSFSNNRIFPRAPITISGWPGLVEAPPEDLILDHSCDFPRISVVTPSFNQGKFIEETIRSVLLQGYPNLEYFIIDGGSGDDSVEIIKKYGKWLTEWISEKDRGQCHAINKGFERATGDILCWINSDDTLEPGALATVGRYFREHPEWQALTGGCYFIDDTGNYLNVRGRGRSEGVRPPESVWHTPRPIGSEALTVWFRDWFQQSSTFWRRELWQHSGPLDEQYFYSMDYELWRRMASYDEIRVIPEILSNYRFHHDAKCMLKTWGPFREVLAINQEQMTDGEFRNYAGAAIGFLLDTLDRYEDRITYSRQEATNLVNSRRYRIGSLLLDFAGSVSRLLKKGG